MSATRASSRARSSRPSAGLRPRSASTLTWYALARCGRTDPAQRGDTGAAFTCAELLDIGGSQTTGFASHYGRGVKNANQVSGVRFAPLCPGSSPQYSKGALFNDVVKAKESVLIATVLPLYGFRGVRNGDNANAVRLCVSLAHQPC